MSKVEGVSPALNRKSRSRRPLPKLGAPVYDSTESRPYSLLDEVVLLETTKSMNLLFVCSENRLRSPTGEEVFSTYEEINAIGCGTNADAETVVSGDLILWADFIFVMEKSHRNKVSKKFRELLKGKKLVCLDIPDEYERMEPALIRLLEARVMRHIPSIRKNA